MINNNTRFLGVDSTKVNLTEKKDSINNAVTQYYTAEEIAGGGSIPYKEFTARVFQGNILNPITLTVFKNDFDSIPTVQNDFGSPFDFLVTLEDEFVFEKTVITSNPERQNIIISYPLQDNSNVAFNCYDFEGEQAAPISFTFTITVYE
jgi:hypothetical protein